MKNRRKARRIKLVIALALFLIIVAGVANGLVPRAMGRWLVVSTPLEKADLIYVYAGEPVERSEYAAKLFRAGWAPRVAAGGILIPQALKAMRLNVCEAEIDIDILKDTGVAACYIDRIKAGTTTFDETQGLLDYMKRTRARSVILVTSPIHTRRVRWTARRVLGGSGGAGIKFFIAPAEHPRIDPDKWWKSEEGLLSVNAEYQKSIYYMFRYSRSGR